MRRALALTVAFVMAVSTACKKSDETPQANADTPKAPPAGKGISLSEKVVRIGALNDESGPAAAIGKPYAIGKRILAAAINSGEANLLPAGWKVELVEKDHGYNPQQAVQHYNAIKDDVLFIATSFGTPNTLPLRDMLTRDEAVAFPASLSSQMAEHAHTPPVGPSYAVEAMRAMDWVVEQAGAENVKAGIVYQQDDYGKDGLGGWKQAAEHHGVSVVAEATVAPGQKDFAAVVTDLKAKGATHVLLATLPSATGPILGTAAQLGFAPVWIGNTASWIDAFFISSVLPPQVLANFYWMSGLPYWGEDVPGMQTFLAAFEKYKPEGARPDFYVLASYIQGLIELEAFSRAAAANDYTRAGYLKALRSIENWTADGLIQPVTLSTLPYVTSTRTRVLKPKLAEGTWEEVAPYAEPASL